VTKTTKAHLALLAANIIYAASFPIAKNAMEFISDGQFVLMRVIGATLLFWLTALLFVKEKTDKADFPRLVLLGVFGVAINQSLFLKGLHLTSSIDAALMMVTTPILVTIIAAISIKEKITVIKMLGIIIGFFGAAFLVYQGNNANGNESSLIGNLYVLINAISWGTYLVLVKPLMQKYHTVTILKWTFLFGLPLVTPLGISDLASTNWQIIPSNILFFMIFVIVFTTFVAYLLNTLALRQLSTSVVSAYIYLQPLLSALIAIWFFNSSITWQKIIAGAFIFAGVYIVSNTKSKN
jgi:drug/metabolite transporter (DMT)-like permease